MSKDKHTLETQKHIKSQQHIHTRTQQEETKERVRQQASRRTTYLGG